MLKFQLWYLYMFKLNCGIKFGYGARLIMSLFSTFNYAGSSGPTTSHVCFRLDLSFWLSPQDCPIFPKNIFVEKLWAWSTFSLIQSLYWTDQFSRTSRFSRILWHLNGLKFRVIMTKRMNACKILNKTSVRNCSLQLQSLRKVSF